MSRERLQRLLYALQIFGFAVFVFYSVEFSWSWWNFFWWFIYSSCVETLLGDVS